MMMMMRRRFCSKTVEIIDDIRGADPRKIHGKEEFLKWVNRNTPKKEHLADERLANTRNIITLGNHTPVVSENVWIAPNATVAGEVVLNDRSSVWYGSVIRGDMGNVWIGGYSNIQDGAVLNSQLRVATGTDPRLSIGNYVTIGSGSVLSACTVHSHSYIGLKTIICDGAIVEPESVVASNSVVPSGKIIPSGEVWGGNPIGFIRKLGGNEKLYFQRYAMMYFSLAWDHMEQFLPLNKAYYDKIALDGIEKSEFILLNNAMKKEQEKHAKNLSEKIEKARKEAFKEAH
eukprot:comp15259_c0_seq1/m.22983 comp15259_c0_seq1/g.22983  ORF comp15259_c0_seq1/g.22983 comp15259_c0_seq1/m.22983 type:complete len:288 (+) comp15259_c0_seq1:102-965(+)